MDVPVSSLRRYYLPDLEGFETTADLAVRRGVVRIICKEPTHKQRQGK